MKPTPLQKPIPLRICAWNRGSSIDLAAHFGGLHVPHFHPGDGCAEHGCFDRVAAMRARIGDEAELAIEGLHGIPDAPPDVCRAFADAGVTWWLETVFTYQMPNVDLGGLRQRIERGPPR